MTPPLFYVGTVPAEGTVLIDGEEARHALSAARLAIGEPVLVGDGRGVMARCRVEAADRRRGLVLSVSDRAVVPPATPLVVVQAVPKGERADLAVELMTEAGVSAIVPWLSARAIPDWRGKQEAKRQRWQRVARAAAKQSRRAWIPEVREVRTGVPTAEGAVLVLHEDAACSLFEMELPGGPTTVVVGPEGGLTAEEVAGLVGGGAEVVRMGPEILRTSTAGAAACVWLRGMEMRRGT